MLLRNKLRAWKSWTVLIAGAVVVFGGTALALVIVAMTATVSSNEFIEPPPPPTGESLALAITDGENISDCEDLAPYSTSAVDLGSVNVDLNSDGAQLTGRFLCVTNNGGTELTQVSFTSTVTASSEDGCSAEEGIVDPEGPTCGTSGELEDLVLFFLEPHTGDVGFGGVAIFPDQENLLPLSGSILPGDTLMLSIGMIIDSAATNAQKAAASTDTVAFSFDVAGS